MTILVGGSCGPVGPPECIDKPEEFNKCTCSVGDAAVPTGKICAKSRYAGQSICCASPGYPSEDGSDCTCLGYACVMTTNPDMCSCGPEWGNEYVGVTTLPDCPTTFAHCCLTTTIGAQFPEFCFCMNGPCPSSADEVSSCAVDTLPCKVALEPEGERVESCGG